MPPTLASKSFHRIYKGQAFPPPAALSKGEGKTNFSQPQDNMSEESKKGLAWDEQHKEH